VRTHEVRWSGADLDRQVASVERGAAVRTTAPPREALVQLVEITDDAAAAARGIAERLSCTLGAAHAGCLQRGGRVRVG
jgi:hypothetical protein